MQRNQIVDDHEILEAGEAGKFVALFVVGMAGLDDFSEAGYARALRRAFALYARPPDWRRVRAAAMRRPADWGAAAAQYIDIYTHALLP